MGWIVKIEDENGNEIKVMVDQFALSNSEILQNQSFRLLKYIDPYGDTTFNSYMFKDLIEDLKELIKLSPQDSEHIIVLIKYAQECTKSAHTYLKFYGD